MKTMKRKARTRDDGEKVREWFYGSIILPSYIAGGVEVVRWWLCAGDADAVVSLTY